jgi:hypothetical protein
MKFSKTLILAQLAAMALTIAGAHHVEAEESANLMLTVPRTVKANTNVEVKCGLTNLYSGERLAGMPLVLFHGDRWSTYSTRYSTDNGGKVQVTWRTPVKPGMYRVRVAFAGGWGYFGEAETVLVNVTK